jgi:RimJ/RimL family protein N-acetyltransferase
MTSMNTDRLILRPWRDADRAAFASLNDDPAVMEFMPRRLTRDESDALAVRVQGEIERRGWGLWAIEVQRGPAFIGFVGLSVPTFDAHFIPCVEIAWRLAKEHWGYGYATEAAERSLRFAFETLSLPQVVSFTVPSNTRSRRVMEHIGMSRDKAGDFEHPRIAPGNPLRAHVLYRLRREVWRGRHAGPTSHFL